MQAFHGRGNIRRRWLQEVLPTQGQGKDGDYFRREYGLPEVLVSVARYLCRSSNDSIKSQLGSLRLGVETEEIWPEIIVALCDELKKKERDLGHTCQSEYSILFEILQSRSADTAELIKSCRHYRQVVSDMATPEIDVYELIFPRDERIALLALAELWSSLEAMFWGRQLSSFIENLNEEPAEGMGLDGTGRGEKRLVSLQVDHKYYDEATHAVTALMHIESLIGIALLRKIFMDAIATV